jgi:hypothetical protein
MAKHNKRYDVYAVGGVAKSIDRSKATRVVSVEGRNLKEAEGKAERFCSLMNCTMTRIKEVGYATKNKRHALEE